MGVTDDEDEEGNRTDQRPALHLTRWSRSGPDGTGRLV